ncbi:hypothetical protein CH063_12391 [Colletotrichum higginsianum]|uniref:Uncharacterized protein n=1 Tax=Colletotrichum higginsianum (strain IMI 349063) TaxID=759273 RepID=H1VQ62_COLHI|nr:hypothetical protein CH063_12391 [Colletotrichum higginsianum]
MVLVLALYRSGDICTSPITVECLDTCPCADSVKLLLEVDSDCVRRAVTDSIIFIIFWLPGLARASWRARDLTIETLRDRRQQLKELAVAWLKPHDIDRLALREPQVLDYYTGEVVEALAAVGVKVPPQLMTEANSDDFFWKLVPGSMYHYIGHASTIVDTVPLAEALYSKGFQDIDVPNDDGLTPLCIQNNVEHSTWLVEHGASLEKPISGIVDIGSIAAHYVFSDLRYSFEPRKNPRRELAELARRLTNYETGLDECICGCSSDGCHPYTKMWKTVLELCVERGTQEELTKEIHERCISIEDGWDIPRKIKSVCLRACTFAALRLQHTCCRHWVSDGNGGEDWSRVLKKPEESEIQEIREEEAVELARLEDLIIEFEGKLDKADCSLAEFFRTQWATRMDEVLGEIEDQVLTEQDIAGARELGVVLEIEAEEGSETDDESQVEYWCRRLDALVE